MGKKKWYVVTVGKAIGVFDTWSEVQPLINGVSGALHESFLTREEAEKIFKRQLESGITKVIGGTQSSAPSPQGLPHLLAPLAFSTNSPLERSSPRMQSRTDAFGPRTSSLEMAAHSESPSPSRRRSRHGASSPSRSISPPVVHPNVSYTRGASSTRSSPQYRQRKMPRTVVRTPTDLQSYPDEEPAGYIYSSHPLPETYTHRSPSVKSDDRLNVFSVHDVPSTPQRRTMRPTIVMRTPSYLQSYPSDEESIAFNTPISGAGPVLSPLPLDYPGFLPPETPSPRLTRQGSDASFTGRPRHHSPSRGSGSFRHSYPRHDSQCQIVHVAPLSSGDHSQCQHTCPHCKNVSVYTSVDVTPTHLPQPMDHVHDPRSPRAKNDIMSSHASSMAFGRPLASPCLDIEHRMSTLFIRA